MEALKNWRPPAITTGLIPFMLILHALGLSTTLDLHPDAIGHLDLNRLSFYPLVFASTIHLLVGILAFIPLCALFELSNGTVRTGIVLNITAVMPALIENLLVWLTNSMISDVIYCGPSSWVLAFAASLSITHWTLPVIPVRNIIINVPAWTVPAAMYLVITILFPPYWLIHLLALLMGYGLGTGMLGFLVEGSTTVVAWIESKIERGINVLRFIVRFVGEVEARELRKSFNFRRRSSIVADEIPLPAASLTTPVA